MLSLTMDEFIPLAKTYLFLLATCDGILSWMIENWMKFFFYK